MITLIKYGALGGGEKYNANIMYIDGLSTTDAKPTGTFEGMPIPNASVYTEIDTGKQYRYDATGATWYQSTAGGGGGGGGVSDYDALSNRPQVNSTTLTGNLSSSDLGLQDTLTETQMAAVNSGITSTDVSQINTNKTNISLKANTSDVNTATANLQAQIDQLITPTTQDAEVQNARVGADSTSYQTLKARLDAENDEISSRIDELYTVSKNIYNPDTDTLGKVIASDGTINDNDTRKISDFIDVEPLSSISVKSCTEYASTDGVMFVVMYDNSKQFMRRQGITATGVGVKVDIDNGAYYIRLVLNINAANIMVNVGAPLLPYAPYGANYNVNIDAIKAKKEAIAASKAYTDSVIVTPLYKFVPLNVTENYEPFSTKSIADDDTDTDFKVSTVTSQQIYNALDALMSAYPQYISRKLLGKDQTNTFNIYEYDLIPEQPEITPTTAEWFDLPTMLICSGIHGDGRTDSDAGDRPVNVCALYYFIKDLCENWRNNETLAYIRFNVNIKIIPIVNPWGFDNKHRYNGNYVDLNRNFDYNWAAGSYGDYTYGASAFSEAESQIVRDFVNANPDAIGFFDFHCTGGNQEQSRLVYSSMHEDSDMKIPINALIKQMSLTWDKRNYDGLTPMNFHGYVTTNTAPTMASWVYGVDEITACNTEVFPNFINSNLKTMGSDIMYMAAEEIGNAVMAVVRYKAIV